jgi:methionyl-tRNA formyltransferase
MDISVALLFQDANFVGREYFHRLVNAGVPLSFVAAVGRMSEASIAIERTRTDDRWNPPAIPEASIDSRFDSLGDAALWQALAERRIDVVVQGGIGILKPDMLAVPRIGFVNVHPGRLPAYRGSSCPEWALYNGDAIYATAHLIDAGIDTGPVICEARYEIDSDWDYHDMRANLYAHCAGVLIDALARLDASADYPCRILKPQDPEKGHYWSQIPADKLAAITKRPPSQLVKQQ